MLKTILLTVLLSNLFFNHRYTVSDIEAKKHMYYSNLGVLVIDTAMELKYTPSFKRVLVKEYIQNKTCSNKLRHLLFDNTTKNIFNIFIEICDNPITNGRLKTTLYQLQQWENHIFPYEDEYFVLYCILKY
jgi:hypothetical protein